jgi:hypothetical protein
MQQWTDQQTVPGIVGNVDGDVFFGDAVAFGKYGYQTPPPPEPESQESSTQTTTVTTPESTTTTTTSTNSGETTTTSTSPTSSVIVNTGTQDVQVPISTTGTEIPPVQANPLPETKPTKPPMRFWDNIVFILLSIKRILWG